MKLPSFLLIGWFAWVGRHAGFQWGQVNILSRKDWDKVLAHD